MSVARSAALDVKRESTVTVGARVSLGIRYDAIIGNLENGNAGGKTRGTF